MAYSGQLATAQRARAIRSAGTMPVPVSATGPVADDEQLRGNGVAAAMSLALVRVDADPKAGVVMMRWPGPSLGWTVAISPLTRVLLLCTPLMHVQRAAQATRYMAR